jgi:hypothetical protein
MLLRYRGISRVLSYSVFGHICHVFFVSEPFTETNKFRITLKRYQQIAELAGDKDKTCNRT